MASCMMAQGMENNMDLSRYKNKAKCRICGDILESKYVHDFQTCECGSIFIDGGNEYWRYGGKDNLIRVYEEREDEK